MVIKRATLRNVNSVCTLHQSLLADMAVYQPYYYRNAGISNTFIKRMLASDRSEVMVALVKNSVVGFAYVKEKKITPYGSFVPHRFAFLTVLAVHPLWRGKGVGTALINAVKKWAKNRGLDYIELNALPQNLNAIRLYRDEGFQTVVHTMRYIL